MIGLPRLHLLAAAAIAGLAGPAAVAISAQNRDRSANPDLVEVGLPLRAGGQLASFKSDADLLAFLNKRRDVARRGVANAPPGLDVASPMAAQEAIVVSGARSSDRITNTQEADVDEGGIVKKRGDLL